jgi:uncharacterized protein (TIGR03083 family)
MSAMEIAEHIAAIASEGKRLAAAAAAAGPGAPVPSCPDWVVRDLVRHQGGVHRWATAIVAGPRTERWDVELDEVVGTWPSDADLIDWFSDGLDRLVAALSEAGPGLVCWTFLRAPSPLAMWARRQAHETAIHRVDAELAADWQVTPFGARFAADGLDELLTCFITRRRSRLRSEESKLMGVRCTDADGEWLVRIGPEEVITTTPGGEAPDCAITGSASALYRALWNRPPAASLNVTGDRRLVRQFGDQVQIRWS